MFGQKLFPVWIGIILLSGMFLMGQDTWAPPTECIDFDEDGYGNPASDTCLNPEWDCNDNSPDINPGVLEGPPGDPLCSDGADNDCDGFVDVYDVECQQCQEDSDCDDGFFCNGAETCIDNECWNGNNQCNDGNVCTNDSCDESTSSCSNLCNAASAQSACCGNPACIDQPICLEYCENNADCSDGIYCNGTESCINNECVAGTPVTCNDSNSCTDDVCVEATDSCANTCNAQGNQDVCCGNVACTGTPVCQGDCEDNNDCNDGAFCNGTETCVNNQCQSGAAPCNDGNSCTDNTCSEAADLCSNPCNATSEQDVCCNNAACSGAAVCAGNPFAGGTFYFQIIGLSQTQNEQANDCLLGAGMVDLLVGLLSGILFPVELPAYTPNPVEIDLPLPFLGSMTLTGSFGDNEITFPGQTFEGIDLGTIPAVGLLGLNCRIDGPAEGEMAPLDQPIIPGAIRITEMVVGPGSGLGACTLTTPDPACTLVITMDGS